MEGLDEDVYVGGNDVAEENMHGDPAIHDGFDGGNSGIPPPPPLDELLGPETNGMQSQEGYGFGGPEEGIFAEAEGGAGGPLLPEPSEMREQGSAFREWRRENMKYLEEKENKEKEMRNQIIAEADEWKRKFYEKRDQTCEANKSQNREREKLYNAQQEKFHKEADNQFWKAIAEIIPREVPNIEKRRGKRDDEKKASVLVIQGPKPGKPTDMARMRQILAKLKTNPPLHMRPPPPDKDKKPLKDDKDNKTLKDDKDNKPLKDAAAGAGAETAPETAESSVAEGKGK